MGRLLNKKFLKLRNIKSLEVVGGRISEYQKLHTP